jgi:hypothetical protein
MNHPKCAGSLTYRTLSVWPAQYVAAVAVGGSRCIHSTSMIASPAVGGYLSLNCPGWPASSELEILMFWYLLVPFGSLWSCFSPTLPSPALVLVKKR